MMNISATNQDGESPISLAMDKGRSEVAELLLNKLGLISICEYNYAARLGMWA